MSGSFRLGNSLSEPRDPLPESPRVMLIGPDPEEDHFPMNRIHRGSALIFSHYFPHDKESIHKAMGEDEKSLRKELEKLNFNVKIHPDKTAQEIQDILKETSEDKNKYLMDSDCLVVAVLSHGTRSGDSSNSSYLILAKDKLYDENLLFQHFDGGSCPSLHGKPKIFIIQACRGVERQKMSVLMDSSKFFTEGPGRSRNWYYLPDAAEFFIFRATYDGTVASGNRDGGFFIRAVCNQLALNSDRNYPLDFMTLMTFAIRQVATNVSQQPTITSTFSKLLYLRPQNNLTN